MPEKAQTEPKIPEINIGKDVLDYNEPKTIQERQEMAFEEMWGKLPFLRWPSVGRTWYIPLSEKDASPTVGDSWHSITVPESLDGASLFKVEAAVLTASASGGPLLIQLAIGANDLLSTRINIDDTEKSSKDAATQPVIDQTYKTLRWGDQIDIDIDDIGDGAAFGWQLYLHLQ